MEIFENFTNKTIFDTTAIFYVYSIFIINLPKKFKKLVLLAHLEVAQGPRNGFYFGKAPKSF